MNEYELMTILSPRLTADETTATVQTVEAQIAAHGGEVLSTDVWGRRRLAYPIKTAMEGTYVLHTLSLPAEGAAPLEAWLMLTEPVLRHLLIRGIIPYQGGHDRDRDRDFDRDSDRDSDRDGDRDRDDDREGGREDRDGGRADERDAGGAPAEERSAAPMGAPVAAMSDGGDLSQTAGDVEAMPAASDQPVAVMDAAADDTDEDK